MFVTTALSLGMGLGVPAFAQGADAVSEAADIVVTARRTEERLQDVPISITVFNQEQLSNANITNTADLATYTPSLQANTRFGSDFSSFSIRGFAQEQRTTASVATYFADTVTPRGGPTLNGGDGAGPGNLFDLQNVQVLNGPQGTLFGRNTTGGAVLLVPNRPSDEFGGYLEVSAGDYDMRRVQGVINVPLSDSARLRVGMDRQQRDGYLQNQSGIGPDEMADVNYEAYRVSFVADLAPNLENYTIASYTHSLTVPNVPRVLACTNNSTGVVILPASVSCTQASLNGVAPASGSVNYNTNGFYDVWNTMEDPHISNNQWQFINTTTWDVNDNLTVKNILNYSELQNYSRYDVYGVAFYSAYPFANAGLAEAYDSARQNTYSDELQVQGTSFGDRLVWQAGLYFEESDPDGIVGSISQSTVSCTNTPGSDPDDWSGCSGLSGTYVTGNLGTLSYQSQGIYTQGTLSITDQLKLTAGYRYTWDRMDGQSHMLRWPAAGGGEVGAAACADSAADANCDVFLHTRSEAPTWTIGLDYALSDDDMIYAKYSRGYRQASINLFGPDGYHTVGPESVDSYEIGAKTGFDGAFPGVFNVALFYNELEDAQLQAGIIAGGAPTTALFNAPSVTTYGAEISAVVELFEGFTVNLAYGYLNTNVDSGIDTGSLVVMSTYITDQELYGVPENKVTVGANYRLPLPESIGDVTLGATYSWVDEQLYEVNSDIGPMPSYENLNLNANWDSMFGGPLDGSLFVTNALDAEYSIYQSGNSNALNFDINMPAPPRMAGVRIRYNFGGEGG